MPTPQISGTVAPGFESVRDEFARNFTDRDEQGAALAVTLNGERVVDLWGGPADPTTGRAWDGDTLQLIFSGSKGVLATALLLLVDRGAVELDKPVAHYWPEFAAKGKDGITVRQVVTFTARMPAVAAPLSQDDLGDPEAMAKLLADQEPESDSRAEGILYGPWATGWIIAEVIRRVDGRRLDRFFAEEIAGPLDVDVSFGITPEQEHRVARTEYGTGFREQFGGYFTSDDPLTQRIWQNPVPFPEDEEIWNGPARRFTLIPAANVYGSARGFAKLYGILAADAARPAEQEHTLLSRRLLDEARAPYVSKVDQLIDVPMVYGGGGYRLRTKARPTVDGDSFGHDGAGGSANQAWPRAAAGVSYVMNRLIALGPDDKRASSLVKAVSAAMTELGIGGGAR
ncbi:serine hydrolase [Streptomyces spinoverrucosus]|uniref:Serine hydrolase n=1 Tax=Streptomyces spinoverrucosus TaxID=284043 RepID=A0A4Y3VUB0_9ACTN|nr:serine hydrolase domain-containing protein [Streptomyces spinoverrucosus]GEC10554.1 serine hydrolase [Streptomyces spinoverrucosus]GHB98667.1 serine hydrolase [Streptomyces spinoverrucosus]